MFMTRLHGKMGQLVITHSHSSERVLRGFAVFADAWLLGWLAEISADLRETVAHQRWWFTTMRYTNPTLLLT